MNNKIKDLNVILIEKERIIDELKHIKNNNSYQNNCLFSCFKEQNMNNKNNNNYLEINDHKTKINKNNIYSNTKINIVNNYDDSLIKNIIYRYNFSYDCGIKNLNGNNDNKLNKRTNILNTFFNKMKNAYQNNNIIINNNIVHSVLIINNISNYNNNYSNILPNNNNI